MYESSLNQQPNTCSADDVDPDQVNARYRDGVLQVSVARRAEAPPKRIVVQ